MCIQNSRNDRDILLPRQSPKVLLYHWGILLQSIGPSVWHIFFMRPEILKTVYPILAVCQSHPFVSCRMSCRLFYIAGTPKDCPMCRQVQQSFLCGFYMFSSSSSPGNSSFVPKWLNSSIRGASLMPIFLLK